MLEQDLNSYLATLAHDRTVALGLEEIEMEFARLGDPADPLALVRRRFANRPDYAVTLIAILDWTAALTPDLRRLYSLDADDIEIIDVAVDDIVGAHEVFVCDLTATDGSPFLRPHYAVWWNDFVFVGPRGVYWLHFARSD